MKRIPDFVKNKYLLSGVSVLIYILFLHNTDIATLINRKSRVSGLENEIVRKKNSIDELKTVLYQFDDLRSLERYAREEHLFKKNDEDIFIFSFE